jgi:hypothetical protein
MALSIPKVLSGAEISSGLFRRPPSAAHSIPRELPKNIEVLGIHPADCCSKNRQIAG